MEILYSWIEKYIAVFLVFVMMSYLIPRDTYRKYIRFFMELVFVFLLLEPVLTFLFQGQNKLGEDFVRSFTKEMEQRQKEAEEMTYLDWDYMDTAAGYLQEMNEGQEGE